MCESERKIMEIIGAERDAAWEELKLLRPVAEAAMRFLRRDGGSVNDRIRALDDAVEASQEAKPAPVVRVCSTCRWDGRRVDLIRLRFPCVACGGMSEWVADDKPTKAKPLLEQELSRYEDSPTCNKGHVNVLPLRLWDCPTCTEEMRAKVRDYKTIGLPERTMMDELMQERDAAIEREKRLREALHRETNSRIRYEHTIKALRKRLERSGG